MTPDNNNQQTQSPAAPDVQQVAKIQSNEQQASSNGQQPPTEKPQKKTSKLLGFADKTLWDWLQLLLIAIVTIQVTIVSGFQNFQVAQITVQQQTKQEQETILQAYMDQISGLVLDKNLDTSKTNDSVQKVARSRTLVVARELDSLHKGFLLRFLYELGLITVNKADIDLSNTDLSGADLQGFDLSNADLHGTILSNANLRGVNLDGANLNAALVTKEQLAQAKSLQGATMPDGSIHP